MLVGLSVTACGGASSDADKDEFCDAWKNTSQVALDSGDFDKMKEAYEDAFDVGTPEDIGDDAREGFEVMKDQVDDVDSEDDLEDFDEPDEDDAKKVTKFQEYLAEECGDALTPDIETPDGMPSDLPSNLPSEMPTELPSELPSAG